MSILDAKRGWGHAAQCRLRTQPSLAGSRPIPGVGGRRLLDFWSLPPVFSRAYAGFAQPGQVEQPVIDAVPAGIYLTQLLAHKVDGQIGARPVRGWFRRVIAAEHRGVSVGQFVVGAAGQADELSFFRGLFRSKCHPPWSRLRARYTPAIHPCRQSALPLQAPRCISGGCCCRVARLWWRCGPTRIRRADSCSGSIRPASG